MTGVSHTCYSDRDVQYTQGFPSLQTHVLSEISDQLAVKAVHSSTQDRDEEDKKHVLVRVSPRNIHMGLCGQYIKLSLIHI